MLYHITISNNDINSELGMLKRNDHQKRCRRRGLLALEMSNDMGICCRQASMYRPATLPDTACVYGSRTRSRCCTGNHSSAVGDCGITSGGVRLVEYM